MVKSNKKLAHATVPRVLGAWEAFCSSLLALALPWEVYQRIPFTELTLVKLAGLVLIVAVFCRSAIERRIPLSRTGLEGPIAVLVAAAFVSTIVSSHRAASMGLVGLCATHLLLFFAMASSVRSIAHAKRLVLLYIVSCSGVGAVTLACKAGLLLPTYWRPSTYPWSQRLIVEAANGTPMRLVAASNDLNQGALLFLLGFAASLFVFDTRTWSVGKRAALIGAQLLMLGGCGIAQSRSALMAAAAIITLSAAWRLRGQIARRTAILFAVGAALGFALAVWIGFTYFAVRDEDSVASRLVAYRAAFDLLPRYMWLGTGLNASDQVIAQTDWGSKVDGATVHSVPLKVLLESGVLGLIGYAWLWVALATACYRRIRCNDNADTRRLGATGLALGIGVLAMSLVQPFMTFPSFSFFFGLVLGPMASAQSRDVVSVGQTGPKFPFVASAVLVSVLVVTNIALYQRGAVRVGQFAQQLETGAVAEREGQYDAALDAYRNALALTGPASANAVDAVPLVDLPGFDALSQVIDLPRAYYSMDIYRKSPNPRSACLYAAGRCYRAIGDPREAAKSLETAIEVESTLAEADFALADIHWTQGRFADAIAGYEKAAKDESLWPNRTYRETTKRYERRLNELLGATPLDSTLEHARILRLRGRWQEAVQLYSEVTAANPECAEALFNLGADAELQNNSNAAIEYYLRAVRACPEHWETLQRLETLIAQQGAT